MFSTSPAYTNTVQDHRDTLAIMADGMGLEWVLSALSDWCNDVAAQSAMEDNRDNEQTYLINASICTHAANRIEE